MFGVHVENRANARLSSDFYAPTPGAQEKAPVRNCPGQQLTWHWWTDEHKFIRFNSDPNGSFDYYGILQWSMHNHLIMHYLEKYFVSLF